MQGSTSSLAALGATAKAGGVGLEAAHGDSDSLLRHDAQQEMAPNGPGVAHQQLTSIPSVKSGAAGEAGLKLSRTEVLTIV